MNTIHEWSQTISIVPSAFLTVAEERSFTKAAKRPGVSQSALSHGIQTAEGVLVLRAAEFPDVEFITYRDDLKGSVTCGPLKNLLQDYVTWRDGPKPGSGIAGAVEFLPNEDR